MGMAGARGLTICEFCHKMIPVHLIPSSLFICCIFYRANGPVLFYSGHFEPRNLGTSICRNQSYLPGTVITTIDIPLNDSWILSSHELQYLYHWLQVFQNQSTQEQAAAAAPLLTSKPRTSRHKVPISHCIPKPRGYT